MSTPARVLLCALFALVVLAPGAQALPVLAEVDATELADELETATAAQGVCYGWRVDVTDSSGGGSGVDEGSDKGAGVPVDPACAKRVTLIGDVSFTCDSCESEDYSSIRVDANFRGAPSVGDLAALGFKGNSLVRDDSDVILSSMVGALPLITASNGAAKPVPTAAPDPADQPAAGDVATGTPSTPDWLREHWLALVFFLLLAGGGAVWLVRQISEDRAGRRGITPRPGATHG